MSTRNRNRALLLTTVGALLACASSALASRPHEFTGTFGERCVVEPCVGAQLKEPAGVAVSEATGDVYVVDKGADRVVRFSAAGVFLGEVTGPNATGSGTLSEGSATIESVLATSGAFAVNEEVTAAGLPVGTKITGVPAPGTLELSNPVEAGGSGVAVELSAAQRFESPETVAVDNSCVLLKLAEPACAKADPSNGAVYVANTAIGNRVVDKFTAAGGFLGQITADEQGPIFFRPDGIMVDREGGLWLLDEGGRIHSYSNALANVLVTHVEEHGLPDFVVGGGLGRDPTGNFYVLHNFGEAPAGKAAKLSSAGGTLVVELDDEEAAGVTVDQLSGNVLVDNLTTVAVFDSAGGLVERLGEEHSEKHLTAGAGVAVNAGAGVFYAADAGAGDVAVFGPSEPSAPKIEGESFSAVTASAVELEAQINPRSNPGDPATTYRFQYGKCPTVDPASCQEAGYEDVPGSAGQLPADFEVHAVTAKPEGLAAHTTYHFRAVAANSHGEGTPGEGATFTTEAAGGQLALPDNRGWELVSPPDKQGARLEPISETGVIQAAVDGSGLAYLANVPTGAHPAGYTERVQVLASRASASWVSRDIAVPHSAATGTSVAAGLEGKLFSPDLDVSVVQPFGPFNPDLSEEASEATAFLQDLGETCGTHCYRPLVTGKPGFANVAEGIQFGQDELCEPILTRFADVFCGPEVLGASEDLRHVVIRSAIALKPGAGEGQLYEWNDGTITIASVLPNKEPAPASSASLGSSLSRRANGAVSSDGASVVWSTASALYSREMTLEQTVQLDKAEAACEAEGECQSGGGVFQFASSDGSRVLFTDTHRLTKDSGADPKAGELRADLYECRIVVHNAVPGCELSDLTPRQGEGANVQGLLLGASSDGTFAYFVGHGVQSETPNWRGEHAQAGKPNLYVRHGGQTDFIATLSGGDNHDWADLGKLVYQPTRVSPDGRFLELMSQAPLTGYDNRDVATGQPVAEVYIFNATTKRLTCASCEPTDSRPVGIEYQQITSGSGGLTGESWDPFSLVAANVPGWTAIAEAGQRSRYQPRNLSDSGRVFFNSIDALVPQDSNGTLDVYEFEPAGVGDCTEASGTYAPRNGGCVSLISSGSSAQESGFLDASESGDDVFFLTSAKLSKLDVDASRDVYDAHVCTSASPCITFPDTQSPPCTNEASCKPSPTPQPSIFGAPASATFSGAGNLQSPSPPVVEKVAKKKIVKCARGKKLKHGKCVHTKTRRKTNHKKRKVS
jgi:DNA-binding beta-propeller fold protein YncE